MRLHRFMMILWAFYFTFGGSTYYNAFFEVRVLHRVLVTILLILWLIGRIRNQKHQAALGMLQTGINYILYGIVGWWFITAITAYDPRMSFEQIWFLLVHVLLFFIIADNIQRGRQRLIMEALFFMAAVVILMTSIELASWYFGLNITPGTGVGWIATGTLPALTDFPQVSMAMGGISTLLAGYTAPLIIVSTGWALTVRGRDYRVVLWLMAALLAIVLLFTSSRGGALSLIAATGTLILTQIIQNPRITARISPRLLAGVGMLLAGGVLVAFVVLTLPNANRASDAGRQDMWQSAVRLTFDHPLTGVGIGNFGRAFRDIRNPAIAQDKLASAHNVYLNTAAETGLPGMILGVVLIGLFLRLAWQNWQTAPSRGQKLRIQVTFAALVGVAVHSLVDTFTITQIVLLIVTLAAYTIVPQPVSRLTPIKQGQRLPALIFLIIISIYGIWLLRLDQAQFAYLRSLNMKNTPQALQSIDEAMALDPYLRLYPLQKAYILGSSEQTDEAIIAYQQALMLEPTWDVGWINLAAVLERQGKIDEAFAALNKAAEINYYNVAALHRSRLAEDNSLLSPDEIVAGYLQSIRYHFHFYLPLGDFWGDSSLRLQALRQFTMDEPIEWQYRIWSVHAPEIAATLVPENPQTAMAWWVVGEYALLIENDAQKAVDDFSQAITLAPKTGDYYASRARALLTINPTAAKHDLDLAQVYGTRFESIPLIRAQLATTPEEKQRFMAQATARFVPQEFAAVLYARPAIFDVPLAMRYPAHAVALSGIVP